MSSQTQCYSFHGKLNCLIVNNQFQLLRISTYIYSLILVSWFSEYISTCDFHINLSDWRVLRSIVSSAEIRHVLHFWPDRIKTKQCFAYDLFWNYCFTDISAASCFVIQYNSKLFHSQVTVHFNRHTQSSPLL